MRSRRAVLALVCVALATSGAVEIPDDRAAGGELSLKDALEISLAAEKRAYDYYDGAIAYVTDPLTEKLFVDLRATERGHQQMLQRELDRLA